MDIGVFELYILHCILHLNVQVNYYVTVIPAVRYAMIFVAQFFWLFRCRFSCNFASRWNLHNASQDGVNKIYSFNESILIIIIREHSQAIKCVLIDKVQLCGRWYGIV